MLKMADSKWERSAFDQTKFSKIKQFHVIKAVIVVIILKAFYPTSL